MIAQAYLGMNVFVKFGGKRGETVNYERKAPNFLIRHELNHKRER